MKPEYWYHKMVLFPIQVRDLLLKSQFQLVHSEYSEAILGVTYSANSSANYLARKTPNPIRWK